MSPSYSLLVHSAKEIQWKPGSRATRAPNLYVTVSLAGVGVFRTLVVRGLSPTWRDQTTLRDLCIGRLKISLDALLELCLGDSGSQVAPMEVSGARGVIPLELIGVSGSLKGKKTGTVYLHIRNVAANASDGAQTIANDSNNDIEVSSL
ncbi:hypothetical protein DFH09DRAFT_1100563 [Mycena vulgaris]|nr:hypothetical protein DFH09DRAFT_1100563 [Mycena vulgaris]